VSNLILVSDPELLCTFKFKRLVHVFTEFFLDTSIQGSFGELPGDVPAAGLKILPIWTMGSR